MIFKKKLSKKTNSNSHLGAISISDDATQTIPDNILKRLLLLQTAATEYGASPVAAIAVSSAQREKIKRHKTSKAALIADNEPAEFFEVVEGHLPLEIAVCNSTYSNYPFFHAYFSLAKQVNSSFMLRSNVTVYGTHIPCSFCKTALSAVGITSVITATAPEPVWRSDRAGIEYNFTDADDQSILDTAVLAIIPDLRSAAELYALNHHEQVSIDGIEVDIGIVDLLKYLWAHGVSTDMSCQGGTTSLNATGYILFSDLPSFNIAWSLIIGLGQCVGLQDTLKNVHWNSKPTVPNPWRGSLCPPLTGNLSPRVHLQLATADIAALNAQAREKLTSN
jgi:tRNA(Arg) A34 adenosine deaminase TadA